MTWVGTASVGLDVSRGDLSNLVGKRKLMLDKPRKVVILLEVTSAMDLYLLRDSRNYDLTVFDHEASLSEHTVDGPRIEKPGIQQVQVNVIQEIDAGDG